MSPLLETFGFSSVRGYRGANGAAAGAYELISTTVLGAPSTLVTFTNGGAWSGYKHLQVRMTVRYTGAVAIGDMYVRLDNVATASYSRHYLQGNGTVVASGGTGGSTFLMAVDAPGGSDTAGSFGVAIMDILDVNSTAKNKTVRLFSGYVGSTNKQVVLHSGALQSTAALSSINLIMDAGTSYAIGSRFSIYGIKGD